jgi:hypothetical protein
VQTVSTRRTGRSNLADAMMAPQLSFRSRERAPRNQHPMRDIISAGNTIIKIVPPSITKRAATQS